MMTDEHLADVFCLELQATGDRVAAARAVRLALQAYRMERRHQRRLRHQRLDDGGRRGVTARAPLDVGQVDAVVAIVAAQVGMSIEGVRTGAARSSLHARWIVAGVLRVFGMSLPVIAKALGMRDHTRALDGLRRLDTFPGLLAIRDRVVEGFEAAGWRRPGTTAPAPADTGPRNEAA